MLQCTYMYQHVYMYRKHYSVSSRGKHGTNFPFACPSRVCVCVCVCVCVQSATKTQQLSSRFHALLAARDQVIYQLVDKEDLLKKELQNKSRSEERLLEEKEGLLKVVCVCMCVCVCVCACVCVCDMISIHTASLSSTRHPQQ